MIGKVNTARTENEIKKIEGHVEKSDNKVLEAMNRRSASGESESR